MNWRRMLPQLLAMTSLCTVGLLLLLGDFVESKRRASDDVKAQYQAALNSTTLQLNSLVYETAENPALRENLNWNLSHVVKKNLESFLRLGELDTLGLFAAGCQPLHVVTLKSSIKPRCFWQKDPSLSWHKSKDTPVAQIMLPFRTEKGLNILVGS